MKCIGNMYKLSRLDNKYVLVVPFFNLCSVHALLKCLNGFGLCVFKRNNTWIMKCLSLMRLLSSDHKQLFKARTCKDDILLKNNCLLHG